MNILKEKRFHYKNVIFVLNRVLIHHLNVFLPISLHTSHASEAVVSYSIPYKLWFIK